MKIKKYLRIPLLLALLLMLFFGCSLKPDNTDQTASNLNTEATVNINQISENGEEKINTSDWLTYTNEEYGFSFKYPSEDKVEEFTDYVIITTPRTKAISQETTGERTDVILIILNEDSFLFSGLTKSIEFSEEYYNYIKNETELNTFLGEINITGHNGFQLAHEEATYTKHTFLEISDNKVIEIYGGYYGSEISDIENNKLEPYDTIVGSIKFSDNLVETSDWDVYESQEVGIRFRYPSLPGEKDFSFIDCSEFNNCDGSSKGASFSWQNSESELGKHYSIAGGSSAGFIAGREIMFSDAMYFTDDGNSVYSVFLSNGEKFEVNEGEYKEFNNGSALLYTVKFLPSYPMMSEEYRGDSIAILNFSSPRNYFKSISFYFDSAITKEQIYEVIDSVELL